MVLHVLVAIIMILIAMTRGIDIGAIEELHVIAAKGGHPTSKTGKSSPLVIMIASTAGFMFSTKKEKITKIPANPTPIFNAEINALLMCIRTMRAMMKIKKGSIT